MAEDDDPSIASRLAPFDSGAVLRDLIYLQQYISLGELASIAATSTRVEAQVIPADDLGAARLSCSELVLHAKRLIVLTEIQRLRQLNSKANYGMIKPLLNWRPFSGLEDLTIYTHHELRRIMEGWLTCRDSVGTKQSVYRGALRDAHAQMRTLGSTSELARFLSTATTDSRGRERAGFRTTCTRILAALLLSIDFDRDSPLMTARPPDTTGGVHGGR